MQLDIQQTTEHSPECSTIKTSSVSFYMESTLGHSLKLYTEYKNNLKYFRKWYK